MRRPRTDVSTCIQTWLMRQTKRQQLSQNRLVSFDSDTGQRSTTTQRSVVQQSGAFRETGQTCATHRVSGNAAPKEFMITVDARRSQRGPRFIMTLQTAGHVRRILPTEEAQHTSKYVSRARRRLATCASGAEGRTTPGGGRRDPSFEANYEGLDALGQWRTILDSPRHRYHKLTPPWVVTMSGCVQ